jgi:DNA repair photolyase
MRYDAWGIQIIEQQTCIECGAPVNEDGAYIAPVIPQMVEHGYTCGICNWGRSDQPRTKEDYAAHIRVHDRCNKETGYHSNPHRGCIMR